jgi:hypothetical protein
MKGNNLFTSLVIFELKNKPSIFNKVWSETYLLLFLNIGLLIGSTTFFIKHVIIIEILVVALFILKLISKRSRQVYKVVIDIEEKKLLLEYYQYVFFSFVKKINLQELSLTYRHKIFGRGKIPKTLEFFECNRFSAEIREKFNLGWKIAEIKEIFNLCNKYCSNEDN